MTAKRQHSLYAAIFYYNDLLISNYSWFSINISYLDCLLQVTYNMDIKKTEQQDTIFLVFSHLIEPSSQI
jgi:hypothetical protein